MSFIYEYISFSSKTDMVTPNKSSTDESLPSKLKCRLLDCFGYTTAHGYGRVAAASESRPRRWFWLLACAFAFGVFTYQFHELTVQFLSRPLKTGTQIHHERVRYNNLYQCVVYKFKFNLCNAGYVSYTGAIKRQIQI